MKKLIILLTLALSFSFVNAEKYPSLKAKDYKNVRVSIEGIDKSHTGLTNKDIVNKVKLTLLKNGFKISDEKGKDLIHVNVWVMAINNRPNDAYVIKIRYLKFSSNHFDHYSEMKSAGVLFTPDQGEYSRFAITQNKSEITDDLSDTLEEFLVDYIESNIE